ncbi:hypothetical protein HDV03_001645 [Kappamyces sp. JEL0829]|nr:hypothetical protein HDV03_001645 [Kappamyces sp. JEL0829]
MPKFSAQEYLQKAQEFLDTFQPELAVKFLERAFDSSPSSPLEIAKKAATTYLDLSQVSARSEAEAHEYGQRALFWLLKWVELSNGRDWNPLLSLATLHVEKQAVEYYEKALVLLRDDAKEQMVEGIERQLSNTLCALAELYMTDCCDDPEAESNCVAYMAEALRADPANPEVYSTHASVLLSQCKPEEAQRSLEKGMDLWYVEPEEDHAPVPDPATWPIFPARLSLAKLLLEVGSWERALSIIETCHSENDEEAQVWYLFGWTYLQMAGDTKTAPEERDSLLHDAKECLEKIVVLQEKFQTMGEEAIPDEILIDTQRLLSEHWGDTDTTMDA